MDEFAQHAAVQATQNVAGLNAAALPQEGKRFSIFLQRALTKTGNVEPLNRLLQNVLKVGRQFRAFLCEPTPFAKLQTPVALLLFGDRGVGKLHIARTIADETNVEKLSPIGLSAAIDDAKAKKGFLFIGTSTDRKRAMEVFTNIDESLYRKIETQLPFETRRRRLFNCPETPLASLRQNDKSGEILATVNRDFGQSAAYVSNFTKALGLHEAGHAAQAVVGRDVLPVQFVTIAPNMKSLGLVR
ncbi:hypothetical protein niasHT_009634 [Heterodera trifolii]|uniref:Uncharacterized protein n=1 Tax=Heterodera trifolii TaxID=157864 RepID=A0ABD2LWS4_9BILA